MVEVVVPHDVEALLVAYLGSFGERVATTVPADRFAGMVRISRTGGGLTNTAQDRANVLAEFWEATSVAAWQRAARVWAMLRYAAHQQDLGGVMLYEADLDVPRTLDDPLAPELHRMQFAAALLLPLTDINLDPGGGTA